MNKRIIKLIGVMLIASVISLGAIAIDQPDTAFAATDELLRGPAGRGGSGSGSGSGTQTPGTGLALTPLSEVEKTALTRAIAEEYGAYNLYQSVINQFGSVYPFSRILLSEQQHINVLVNQATKYGVTVPENTGSTSSSSFGTLRDACTAGVAAEIADAALYDELNTVVVHSDLLRVFNSLQSASLNYHLPAFQVCQ
jgi:hypothetical protein